MWSYSRVQSFKICPKFYEFRYIKKVKTITEPSRPLSCGKAIHKYIETNDIQTALNIYRKNFNIYSNWNYEDEIRIIESCKKLNKLPQGKHEVKIQTDNFIGFADLITDNDDIYDFKFTTKSKIDDNTQLCLYKHYGKFKGDLYYVLIPNSMIRQKKDETILQFRNRLIKTMRGGEIKYQPVNFDINKVKEFEKDICKIKNCKQFKKHQSNFCRFCEYQKICN